MFRPNSPAPIRKRPNNMRVPQLLSVPAAARRPRQRARGQFAGDRQKKKTRRSPTLVRALAGRAAALGSRPCISGGSTSLSLHSISVFRAQGEPGAVRTLIALDHRDHLQRSSHTLSVIVFESRLDRHQNVASRGPHAIRSGKTCAIASQPSKVPAESAETFR